VQHLHLTDLDLVHTCLNLYILTIISSPNIDKTSFQSILSSRLMKFHLMSLFHILSLLGLILVLRINSKRHLTSTNSTLKFRHLILIYISSQFNTYLIHRQIYLIQDLGSITSKIFTAHPKTIIYITITPDNDNTRNYCQGFKLYNLINLTFQQKCQKHKTYFT
jgi:hypothetical protein